MAINLLRVNKSPAPHIPLYDLQSFFYVFIWICCVYKGPNDHCEKLPRDLQYWIDTDMHKVGTIKSGQLSSLPVFEKEILSLFTEYFADLGGLARNLYNTLDLTTMHADLLGSPLDLTYHDRVLHFFEQELDCQRQRDHDHQERQVHDSDRQEQQARDRQPHVGGTSSSQLLRRSPRGNADDVAKLVNNQLNPRRK